MKKLLWVCNCFILWFSLLLYSALWMKFFNCIMTPQWASMSNFSMRFILVTIRIMTICESSWVRKSVQKRRKLALITCVDLQLSSWSDFASHDGKMSSMGQFRFLRLLSVGTISYSWAPISPIFPWIYPSCGSRAHTKSVSNIVSASNLEWKIILWNFWSYSSWLHNRNYCNWNALIIIMRRLIFQLNKHFFTLQTHHHHLFAKCRSWGTREKRWSSVVWKLTCEYAKITNKSKKIRFLGFLFSRTLLSPFLRVLLLLSFWIAERS